MLRWGFNPRTPRHFEPCSYYAEPPTSYDFEPPTSYDIKSPTSYDFEPPTSYAGASCNGGFGGLSLP